MSKLINPFKKMLVRKSMNVTDLVDLKARCEKLLEMDISTKQSILEFQDQRDFLEKHIVNEWSESYFLMTSDVADEERKLRKEFVDQSLSPLWQEYTDKFNTKFLESSNSKNLGEHYDILIRNLLNEKEIFHRDNIELKKQIDKLSTEISEIQGRLQAEWKGESLQISQLQPFLKSVDRNTRKEAYDSMLLANLSVSDLIDDKFDELLVLRNQIAKNAGFDSYTKYRFKELQRFDWKEEDCFKFHEAVKKHILPLRDKFLELKKKNLKIDEIKYYDIGADIYARAPLQIFEKGNCGEMIEGCGKIIKAVDIELYKYFCEIRDNGLLDLESRKNKSPGGYMLMYPVYEQASVFYNDTGLGFDLMVLLHELGHCFHYFLGKDVVPFSLQYCTSEVSEAGSMSMEYIGLEELHHYLDADKAQRLKQDKLMSVIGLFINCSIGDEFQHWLYANPSHTKKMRQEKWRSLLKIYFKDIDNDGREDDFSKVDWQFLHILQLPFYLIDYAISELLAISIWDRYKNDPKDAISKYKNGCRLVGSKSVPEVYEEFGTN